MTPILDVPPVPAYQIVMSEAASPEAASIACQITEVARELDQLYSMNRNRHEALMRLGAALDQLRVDDLDLTVTAIASAEHAKGFIRMLPEEFPPAEIDLAGDGEILFEWIAGRSNRLVISFSPFGELNYASIHPTGESKGKEYFAGAIPQPLSLALGRILG